MKCKICGAEYDPLQIKDKVGLEKCKNYNSGYGEGKNPICPPEKEGDIMEAFRHYNLI